MPHLVPTAFGHLLLDEDGWDPWLEDPASLWLLHWKLLGPGSECTAPVWWTAFNLFAPDQFEEYQLTDLVAELAAAAGWKSVMESSIKKDVDCLLRTFAVRRTGRQTMDDVLDCPTRQLGLIAPAVGETKSWRFVTGPKPSLPPAIVAYACLDFLADVGPKERTISVARLSSDPGAPGRAFRLTESNLYDILVEAAKEVPLMRVAEPAGLRQLIVDGDVGALRDRIISNYYRAEPGDRSMTAAIMLGTQIQPKQRYLRAANLEAHEEQAEYYIPTSRALEVLRRLVNSMGDASAGRSWSLTGPYGAGKSSFALFLRTLLGPPGPRRDAAERALRDVDNALLQALVAARAAVGAADGFVLATTTCQQEPLADSLLRALVKGTQARWPKRRPAAIEKALGTAHASKSARDIVAAGACYRGRRASVARVG